MRGSGERPHPASVEVTPEFRRRFQRRVVDWYRRHGRDLPWRRTSDPYHVAVSEILLQQTQARRVAPVFEAFVDRFPTVGDLHAAPVDDVKRLTDPLGYHVRGTWLKELAARVVERHGGELPTDLAELRGLPGLGPYAAAAVMVFGHRRRAALLDTNIARVYTRSVGLPSQGSFYRDTSYLTELAECLVPARRFFDYHQGLMDLGATICTAARPKCGECPLRADCRLVNGGPAAARWRRDGIELAAERTVGYRVGSGPTRPGVRSRSAPRRRPRSDRSASRPRESRRRPRE